MVSIPLGNNHGTVLQQPLSIGDKTLASITFFKKSFYRG